MRMAPITSRRSSGHRLALGDEQDRLVVDLALRLVEELVVGDDLARQAGIGIDQRQHRLVDHALRMPAHRRKTVAEIFQLLVIGMDDMGVHCGHGDSGKAGFKRS